MKNSGLFLFILFWFTACTQSEIEPVIKVDKVYINNDMQTNYADINVPMPILKIGDKVYIELALDGNGSDLKAFNLKNTNDFDTELNYQKGVVSDDTNLTKPEKGQLRFVDKVKKTQLTVESILTDKDANGDAKLLFYLSSKSEGSGAQKELDFKVITNK